jgi:cupin fold WbuC family metalloprotein
MLKKYTGGLLEDVINKAKNSDRLRTNLNIHESPESSVQRLFLAFEPGTYIRPHRHPQANKWELFIVLDGELDMLIFSDAGDVVERIEMSSSATRVVEVPPGTWHTYICKRTGTLALEIKEGPYEPTTEEDFLSMSPAENTSEANTYYQWMKNAAPSQAY